MSITGQLSSVGIDLDLSQFSLIMGMLGENLGEQLDAFIAPSSVIIDPLEFVSCNFFNVNFQTQILNLFYSNICNTENVFLIRQVNKNIITENAIYLIIINK